VSSFAAARGPFQYTTLASTLAAYRLRKATLEPPLRYLKQQESSNARDLIAQAIIDGAHKGSRERDEKRRRAYEDPDRLNRREA